MSLPFHPHPIPCRNCGTILEATDAAVNSYSCPECLEPVCYVCGCVESYACTMEVANADQTAEATYNCSWADVGTCSFCLSRAAYEFYQQATDRSADDPYYMDLGRTVRAVKGLAYGV